ncbi:hypothetical protein BO85DRAFT_282547 [Aspergillus piperis CBS 112811]|uniref:Uncharacterized protein n=1 Tax=Aspergillus piperis CBS 112811 TaxID=1448313 RepID=A0A8G1VPH7_9EURO|nr:hypothetical protein BO85DRAFT_282547 [Aspergillus piperis CBS 112811]RAH57743.1 hypothetical protein BO85DRAFT_282547 [Aspergillus piperis CBS 112811]
MIIIFIDSIYFPIVTIGSCCLFIALTFSINAFSLLISGSRLISATPYWLRKLSHYCIVVSYYSSSRVREIRLLVKSPCSRTWCYIW